MLEEICSPGTVIKTVVNTEEGVKGFIVRAFEWVDHVEWFSIRSLFSSIAQSRGLLRLPAAFSACFGGGFERKKLCRGLAGQL